MGKKNMPTRSQVDGGSDMSVHRSVAAWICESTEQMRPAILPPLLDANH